jgi:hypothetical protein
MRLLNYLNEVYLNRVGIYEIFKNPDRKEIQSINHNYIRYIADFKENDLYVWDNELIHYEVIERVPEIYISWDYDNIDSISNQYYSYGEAKVLKNGKLQFHSSETGRDRMENNEINNLKWVTMDDTWLNKWFNKPYTKTFLEVCKRNVVG